MINLTINGEKLTVVENSTVLEAAQQAGIHIPTMCSHKDLTPYGACRLCVVEVKRNGRSVVTTSCNTPVEEGMVVTTETEEVNATRKTMAELLYSRCPEVPAVQRMAASVGLDQPAFTNENPKEDCILCGMCVRACDEIAHEHVLGFVGRGMDRKVTTAFNVRQEVCNTCNKCVTYCPTGAITTLEAPRIGLGFKKKANTWKVARVIFQYTTLLVFLGLMAATLFNVLQPLTVNIFSRLNPLQALVAPLAGRELITNYIPALLTVVLTLVFGRVWCGWFCPLGAVFELFGRKDRHFKWQNMRKLKYVILAVIVVMAAFGGLAFMWFEPITIFIRGLTAIFKPLIQYVQLEKKKDFIMPGFQWFAIAIPFVFALLVNIIEKRFWCRYLCPLGALVGLGSKFSWIKRFVNQDSCVKCGECASICPMGAISPANDFKSDPAECIMCMDCGPVCPKLAITFPKGQLGGWGYEFDPGRREALGTIGVSAVAVGLLSLDVGNVKAAKRSVLRPPGAYYNDFLTMCIRCDQCIEACPTHYIQPAAFEAGWDSLFTPIVDPFVGYCAYDCTVCGEICPSHAIPLLTLDQKRTYSIGGMGWAKVDFETCIRCNSCLEECPYKCFEEVEVEGLRGVFPRVRDDANCVGCGICVDVCPKQELKAIEVHPYGQVPEETHKFKLYTRT